MNSKEPPKNIPEELIDKYTLSGKIPKLDWYFNDSVSTQIVWKDKYVQDFVDRFTRDKIISNKCGPQPYSMCDNGALYFVNAFDAHPIYNKEIAIVGSQTPWIEAIALNYGAKKVTTIEYNVPKCSYPGIETISYDNFEMGSRSFDCIITYSSIEHSGLGRYGDPLDPNGDLKTMDVIYRSLKNNGLLYWGAPIGRDALVWNAHRIYGPLRLPLIFKNFHVVEWFGYYDDLMRNAVPGCGLQPVIILKKKNGKNSDKIVLKKNLFIHESGNCYATDLPQYYIPFDSAENNYQSTLKLYEDDVLLTKDHTIHEAIRKNGFGTYSHWYNSLYFSSSDNSDPRTNNKIYCISMT